MKIQLRSDVDPRADGLRALIRTKAYVVLSVESFVDEIWFRVVCEDNELPVLFRASLFDVVDKRMPPCWQVLDVQANAIELGPAVFGEPGFWERYFDREPEALLEFQRAKEQLFADS